MELENLLGRYSEEEQLFLQKVKKKRPRDSHSTESRGGMMKIGRKMDSKFDFLPTEEEIDRYISDSLGRLLSHGE